jgi:hypothetical protein
MWNQSWNKRTKKNECQFLIVNLVKTYELQCIFDFIKNRISERPHCPVSVIKTLFKQTQISKSITIGNQSFRNLNDWMILVETKKIDLNCLYINFLF